MRNYQEMPSSANEPLLPKVSSREFASNPKACRPNSCYRHEPEFTPPLPNQISQASKQFGGSENDEARSVALLNRRREYDQSLAEQFSPVELQLLRQIDQMESEVFGALDPPVCAPARLPIRDTSYRHFPRYCKHAHSATQKLKRAVESPTFHSVISVLVILDTALLSIELCLSDSRDPISRGSRAALEGLNFLTHLVLYSFVIETVANVWAQGIRRFLESKMNVFDFCVVWLSAALDLA